MGAAVGPGARGPPRPASHTSNRPTVSMEASGLWKGVRKKPPEGFNCKRHACSQAGAAAPVGGTRPLRQEHSLALDHGAC